MRCIFALGCIFPDFIEKTAPYGTNYIIRLGEYYGHFPRGVYEFPRAEFLHAPIVIILSVYLFCFAFSAAIRKKVFLFLSLGVFTHVFFDLLQGNICNIEYLWGFPFSFERSDKLRLFFEDETTPLVPVFLLVFVVMEMIYHYSNRKNRDGIWKK